MMRYKYPKTYHLPWSLGVARDDKVNKVVDYFKNKEIVVTEKMDGENATLYCDYYHARSLDSKHHPSRDWLKNFHATFADQIPIGWRICGENMYAKHSIAYNRLDSFFYAFSLWDGFVCKAWDETVEWFELLNLTTVPVLYRGLYDEDLLKDLAGNMDCSTQEGYVVRVAAEFNLDQFSHSVSKFVRQGHVNTDQHWMYNAIEPNKLREVSDESKR